VIRIVLMVVLLLLVFWGVQAFKKIPASIVAQLSKFGAWLACLLLLLALVASGKLNGVFALLGVLIASLMRWMPVILKYALQLHRWWQWFGAERTREYQAPLRHGKMTAAEALEVLGLKPGASRDDIILAHRKLIARLHPDKGGSDYLAAQINLAKKVLLGS